MTTIDSKVVEMRFDNKQFEQGVSQTMSTLDKLKNGLKFTGASKGLSDISDAARNCDVGALGRAAETVQMKFSAMQAIAVGALMNIGAQAINAGTNLVKSLTIAPITQGFQEYETQMNSVQTILANTSHQGTTLKDVTAALDELNHYADQTIYNFTEMTRNIGTFTAAGVDLDTSTSAIQGIANLAAVSGSNSEQASRAMYQLSQALAAGRVSLMDWNSVVNAGMGGKVFQNALIETSEMMGTGAKDAIKKYGSFRESLTQGEWLTTDVLTQTLKQFTMAAEEGSEEWKAYKKELKDMGYTEKQAENILKMANTATDAATKVKTFTQLLDTLKEAVGSGWAKTWQILFGDFEEAKELWTGISDVLGAFINKQSAARNQLLGGWKDLGGRKALLDGFKNIFEGIVSVIKPIAQAFRDIFPPMTVGTLLQITQGFKELTSHFKLGEKSSQNLRDTFKGLFSIFDIFRMVIGGVFEAIKPLFGGLDNVGGGILGVTGAIGRFITKVHDVIESCNIFAAIGKVIGKAFEAIKWAVKGVSNVISDFGEAANISKFGDIIDKVADRAVAMKDAVVGAFKKIRKALSDMGLVGVLETIFDALSAIAGGIGETLGAFIDSVINKLSSADFSGLMASGGLLSLILLIKNFVNGLGNPLEAAEGFIENIKDVIGNATESLQAMQSQLKAKTLGEIAKAIGILALSLLVVSMIDADKLAASLAVVTALMIDLMAAMRVFAMLDGLGIKTAIAVGTMTGIAFAILVLSFALKNIASLDIKGMATGLAGVGGLIGMITAMALVLNKNKGKIFKASGGIVMFAIAIKILASACEDFASMGWTGMAKGLIGVGALIGAIALFATKAKFDAKFKSVAFGVLLMAGALKIMADACSVFAAMRVEDLIKSLGTIGGLLLGIGIFLNKTSKVGGMVSFGVGLIALAVGLSIFADAVAKLGAIKVEDLIKGLGGMAIALITIAAAMKMMPTGGMISAGVGMLIVAGAMVVLADALGKMGNMSGEAIAKSLIALGGSLFILGKALKFMTGTLAGSAALVVASVAVSILAGALIKLGGMSWKGIVVSFIALAGAFAIVGAAAILLAPVIPAILALAGALALIGAAVALFGVGVVAVGAGLGLIAAGLIALHGASVVGVKALELIVNTMAGLLPGIATAFAKAIAKFAETLTEAIPVIGKLFKTLILTFADIVKDCAGPIVEAVVYLLDVLLTKLVEYTPKFAQAILDIVAGLLDAIADNLGRLIKAGADIIINLLKGLAEEIPRIMTAAVDIIVAFLDGIVSCYDRIIQAGFDLILGFITGLTDAINKNAPVIAEAMKGLVLAMINAALTFLTTGVDLFYEAGALIMDSGLLQGIAQKVVAVKDKIIEGVKSGLSGITTKAGEFLSAGKNLFQNVINGIGSKLGAIKTKAGTLINSAKNAITNKVGSFLSAGKQLFSSVISGIGSKLGSIKSKAGELAQAAKDKVASFSLLQTGRDLIQGLINGIGEKAQSLVNKAEGVVDSAIRAAKNLLGINSPSRVFMQFGRYMDEGMIIGLQQMAGKVVDATTDVGKGAIAGMSSVMSRIGDSIDTDIDANPTITPVIDLTEIQNGITRMNSMFTGQTVSMRASIDSAVDRTSGLSSNYSGTTDIVNAINRLRTDISNMKTTENNLNFNGTIFNDDARINNLMVSLLNELARKGAMGIG